MISVRLMINQKQRTTPERIHTLCMPRHDRKHARAKINGFKITIAKPKMG